MIRILLLIFFCFASPVFAKPGVVSAGIPTDAAQVRCKEKKSGIIRAKFHDSTDAPTTASPMLEEKFEEIKRVLKKHGVKKYDFYDQRLQIFDSNNTHYRKQGDKAKAYQVKVEYMFRVWPYEKAYGIGETLREKNYEISVNVSRFKNAGCD